MKKTVSLLLACTLLSVCAFAQPRFTFKIKADSVLITNDSCEAELNLENSTKNVKGFLYNTGNGRTIFKQGAFKIDSLHYLVGSDTIDLTKASGYNAWRTTGNLTAYTNFLGTFNNASLRIRTNNIQRAVIDSNGIAGFGTSSPLAQFHIKAVTDTTGLIIQGSASQTRNLLDLRDNAGNVLSSFNKAGGFYFSPPMNLTNAAIHLKPTFNGSYYGTGPFDAILLDGAWMSQFGTYTGGNWSYVKIKDAVGSEIFGINNKGKLIIEGSNSINSRDGSIFVNPNVSGMYHTNNDFDNVYITAVGLENFGLYNGHKFRLLRVKGLSEALTATKEGNIGIGTISPNSKIQVTGSVSMPIASVSLNTTLNATHYTVTVNAASGNRTITLPTAVGAAGRIYIIKKSDSSGNTVTIATTNSETIDGAGSKVLSTQYAGYTVQSDDANWVITGIF